MKDQIFISYRRKGGDVAAKFICDTLAKYGYSVYFDLDSLTGGCFNDRIMKNIEECKDVVLVLSLGALDRCADEADLLRREISYALKRGKNIIPVLLNGFEFPADLPSDIAAITRFNGVRYSTEYFDAVIDKIKERLDSKPTKAATIVARPKPAAKIILKPMSKPVSKPTSNKPAQKTDTPIDPMIELTSMSLIESLLPKQE